MKTKTTYTEQRSLVPLGVTAMIARLKAEPSTSGEAGETLRLLVNFILFILALLQSTEIIAQKYDYNWLLGVRPGGDSYPQNCMNIFDFNDDSLKISKDNINSEFFLTNASISDDDGNLLFYTNGCYIKDRMHNIMPYGDGLNPGIIYEDNCPDYGYTATEGATIIPPIAGSDVYYVFHTAYDVFNISPIVRCNKLYYSVVDMGLNNGLGAVIVKNQIVLDKFLETNIQAIKHENNEDWWVITSKLSTPTYYRILLTAQGIASIDSQQIGNEMNINADGQPAFTPDGKKYVRYDFNNQLRVMDFDRSTGLFSNFQQVQVDTANHLFSGLAVSPNSRFVYISAIDSIYQLDLEAPDIAASKVTVGAFDGFRYQDTYPVYFFYMRLGPDCRIYNVPFSPAPYMHVIFNPDEKGLACNFVQRAIELPCIANYSLPNFPNYRLGTGYPVCDSNIVYTASGFTLPPVQGVNLYPNPASGELNLEFSTGTGKPVVFRLYDTTGRLASYWTLEGDGQPQSLNISGLASGLYLWQLNTVDGLPLDKGKLVIEK